MKNENSYSKMKKYAGILLFLNKNIIKVLQKIKFVTLKKVFLLF